MDFEVLISCMFKNDFEIIHKSNLDNVPVLIINQTDVAKERLECDGKQHRRLDTNTRGLSVSRNMAIRGSSADICLLCDDDEIFVDSLEKIVLDAYKSNPEADIICFSLENLNRKIPVKKKRIGYLSALTICSVQISFRRERIAHKGIHFDARFGSGTSIGSGEENILLYDCLKKGLRIVYLPVNIGSIRASKSKWNKTFNEQALENQGIKARRLLGIWGGTLYCIYFACAKYKKYKNNVSWNKAIRCMQKGVLFHFD